MKRKAVEFVQAGNYAAEVAIELVEDEGWSPRMTLADARRLETVRLALERGDIATAARYGRVFELMHG